MTLVAVSAIVAAGIVAGSQPSVAVSQADPAAASSLPAWGTEPVPQYGSDRSEVHAISVLSASQAWAVGVVGDSESVDARPLVERWTGSSWSVVSVPHISHAELYGVVAVGPDDVWMVGTFNNSSQSLVLHWDGSAIERVDHPNPGDDRNDLYAVTAIGPNDVWAVGDQVSASGGADLLTLHWDGSRWQAVNAPGTASYDALRSVTAVSADDIWAVGVLDYQAATLHWDGTSWTRVDVPLSGEDTSLSAAGARAPDDVWAVGQDAQGSVALRWDGSQWNAIEIPQSGGTLRDDLSGVQVLGTHDVWATGTSYIDGNPGFLAWHWNGHRWSLVSTPHPPASTAQLESASTGADGTFFVAGSLDRRASVLQLEDGAFQRVPVHQVGKDVNQLFGISADGSDDIWAVGSVGQFNPAALTLHYDGSTWERVPAPAPPQGTQLEDVVALAPDDAWAVGYTNPGDVHRPVALHWDGTNWQATRVPGPGVQSSELLGVDALAPDDVWAVGVYSVDSDPTTLFEHWDGSTWSLADTSHCHPLGGLSGIGFVSPDDGWAVGHASICQWDGRGWTLVPSPQPRPQYGEIDYPLQDLSGVSADDVWAVGYILYYAVSRGTSTGRWPSTGTAPPGRCRTPPRTVGSSTASPRSPAATCGRWVAMRTARSSCVGTDRSGRTSRHPTATTGSNCKASPPPGATTFGTPASATPRTGAARASSNKRRLRRKAR
jgi:hypothetical protein